jgi:copper oxidase (laccase) domain-containing protein
MLVQIDEAVVANAVAAMMTSCGEMDEDTAAMIDFAAKVREADCTPLYLLDLDDQSIGVYILETYGKRLH